MDADLLGQLVSTGTAAHDTVREGHSVWTAWTLDLPVILPACIVGFFYARGLRRWTVRHRQHPWWKVASYYLGLGSLVLAIVSPIDSIGAHHFFMHMIQHEIIMLISIPLLLLGAPTTPVLRGMPKWLRLGVVAGLAADPIVRMVWRFLTQPLIALIVSTGVLVAWHLIPGWYDAAVRNANIHYIQHLSFAGTAFLFWWNVIDPAPLRASMGYLLRMVYILVAATAQSVIAAMITLSDRTLYDVYVTARPIYDMSPHSDQELGGLIMWVPGQMVHLIVIGALFAVWAAQSERRQREIEQQQAEAEASASLGAAALHDA
ncbi:MAG: cytochrome c oxidase assembly protein [Dehalococcoidia bacterium]|nr:cytochrome c oxidase assembly protein [Dehalococcoidia bacterium]